MKPVRLSLLLSILTLSLPVWADPPQPPAKATPAADNTEICKPVKKAVKKKAVHKVKKSHRLPAPRIVPSLVPVTPVVPFPVQSPYVDNRCGDTLPLLAAHFTVDQPAQMPDMDRLAYQLPVELASRLSARQNGHIQARAQPDVTVLPDPTITDPASGSAGARQLGWRENVRYVLAGRVIDTSVSDHGLRISILEATRYRDSGSRYEGPLSSIFDSGVLYRATERQFDAEFWLYDTATGAVLATDRVHKVAKGKVLPPQPAPFGSVAFWQSDYGRVVDSALTEAVDKIGRQLACPSAPSGVGLTPAGGTSVSALPANPAIK
ncbi:flagella assembly protein FlgT middle domain-containing protein [Crenobacter sp. SG2303]|uniref:Flagella assembly protein FlgT middle domain-containing protein n=1 Tax=Crenobacter oryzisoli TaxID=3056844 RepID=A0ABT7XK87_9NEIS|nr:MULTISPECIES: flagella assembly protein FlgT middle domain-containing protein [unclassified Crenobacter]MDN0074201.1 flagella assembly protein FlgT middle domain-containing protein [Crenobacter sp. SG2303]MDN0083473.1 flagella assembly protein FlgT middle domain-containing protein [Crenobacter sp. SG2305]